MARLMANEKSQELQLLDLSGARILLVEDEYYIADDLRRTLIEAGAAVVGPFSNLEKARHAIETETFDCAVIDLNLHGDSGLPVADLLFERGKSFAIATGYGCAAVPESLQARAADRKAVRAVGTAAIGGAAAPGPIIVP
jgi:Response regulator containing CheY-like receiver, AAA-type ATPase, and DNA-binding domains